MLMLGMLTTPVGFEEVAELAAQLSPEEQLRLVARIGADLSVALAQTTPHAELPVGSSLAVLRAIREPPRLSGEDVEELERMIAVGKLPVKREGVFDSGDAK